MSKKAEKSMMDRDSEKKSRKSEAGYTQKEVGRASEKSSLRRCFLETSDQ